MSFTEPDEVIEEVKNGRLAERHFHGQTLLYIPNPIINKLGRPKIVNLAREVYGEVVMSNFWLEFGEYENSHLLWLPPTPHGSKTWADPRLDRLKELILENST